MRRILVESARRKQAAKRGGNRTRLALMPTLPALEDPSLDIVALDEALTMLEEQSPEKAELVKLRFFAGLTIEEAATTLDISCATAKRHWAYARAWLYGKLKDTGNTLQE
jgi:RNA polymerase sigma factor (TIGR02999 family)